MLGNSVERFGLPARLLHASLALLVLGLVVLGWWMMVRCLVLCLPPMV